MRHWLPTVHHLHEDDKSWKWNKKRPFWEKLFVLSFLTRFPFIANFSYRVLEPMWIGTFAKKGKRCWRENLCVDEPEQIQLEESEIVQCKTIRVWRLHSNRSVFPCRCFHWEHTMHSVVNHRRRGARSGCFLANRLSVWTAGNWYFESCTYANNDARDSGERRPVFFSILKLISLIESEEVPLPKRIDLKFRQTNESYRRHVSGEKNIMHHLNTTWSAVFIHKIELIKRIKKTSPQRPDTIFFLLTIKIIVILKYSPIGALNENDWSFRIPFNPQQLK